MRTNLIISILISICVVFSQTSIVLAKEPFFLDSEELDKFGFSNYENINPNLLIYPLKRAFEQIRLTLTFDKNKKRDYFYELYHKRYQELVFIINSNKDGFIPFTSNRYNSFVGNLKQNYPPNEDEAKQIRTYLRLLERLRDIFPANSASWEKIQQSIDTTRSLI